MPRRTLQAAREAALKKQQQQQQQQQQQERDGGDDDDDDDDAAADGTLLGKRVGDVRIADEEGGVEGANEEEEEGEAAEDAEAIEEDDGYEDSLPPSSDDDQDEGESGDEWIPSPTKADKAKAKADAADRFKINGKGTSGSRKRGRKRDDSSSSSESSTLQGEDSDAGASDEGDRSNKSQPKPKAVKTKSDKKAKVASDNNGSPPARPSRPGDDYGQEIEDEEERMRLSGEAQQAWEQVRRRKEEKSRPPVEASSDPASRDIASTSKTGSASTTSGASSLNSWLGLPPLPTPYTHPSLYVTDRDSLFIPFLFPLTSSSPSSLSTLLNHLTTTIHPSLPSSIFPPQFSHLAPTRRGSSHDVHAFRVLSLKPGRTGLAGPNDFGLEEGSDDDGEKWASEKVLRVMREQGAVDALLVVSRWYGGTNLGPVRFEHIVRCARGCVKGWRVQEEVRPLKEQLEGLDEEIAKVRGEIADLTVANGLPPPPAPVTPAAAARGYDEMTDPEMAKRLVVAREKTLEVLKKKKKQQQQQGISRVVDVSSQEEKDRQSILPEAGAETEEGPHPAATASPSPSSTALANPTTTTTTTTSSGAGYSDAIGVEVEEAEEEGATDLVGWDDLA